MAMDFASLQWGQIFTVAGAVTSVVLGGMGSSRGVRIAGEAAAGVTAEDPDKFGKLLVLQALPGTQGIYGFLIGFLILLLKLNLFGTWADIAFDRGLILFLTSLPVGMVGYFSGVHQGTVAAAAIAMVGRQPDASGKGITMTVLVETYAVLAFLASILLLIFAV